MKSNLPFVFLEYPKKRLKWKCSKKADELVIEQIIFVALNLVFIMLLLFFVWRVGTGAASVEEKYAKKIGLAIDSIKPGTELKMDISELYPYLERNKIKDSPIIIDYSKNIVNVKVSSGKGYSFRYFSDFKQGFVGIEQNTKLLIIKS